MMLPASILHAVFFNRLSGAGCQANMVVGGAANLEAITTAEVMACAQSPVSEVVRITPNAGPKATKAPQPPIYATPIHPQSSGTLSLVYKGHDLQGSLVKILAKIGVRSKGELDKQF